MSAEGGDPTFTPPSRSSGTLRYQHGSEGDWLIMGCNAWNHVGCNCGWGGVNHGRAATSAGESLSRSTARQIWRSFLNPNARCPVCRSRVFYYQSENGGRVFFDQLGPPWDKHPCTNRSTWRWPAGGEFILKEGDVREPGAPPGWQRAGWVPVAKVRKVRGRPARKIEDRLMGAIVWSADASELKVLWLERSRFDWSGQVMMRPDPRSPHRVEFETVRLNGDIVRIERLIAVKNDILTTVPTLLSRLREKR